jgi:hypothetical protein
MGMRLIESDEDLETALAEAGYLLQMVQNHLGLDRTREARVRFPRGFLRTAHTGRQRLGFVKKPALRTNLAYSLLLSDVYLWILLRTDLAGTARDMLVKANLALAGSIAEALLADHYHGVLGKRQRFTSRTAKLLADGAITQQAKDDLDWLWDVRCRQHLFEIDDSEFDAYSLHDNERGVTAVNGLIDALHARARR